MGHEMTEEWKSVRKKRIGEKANSLMKLGYYDRDDVLGIKEMVDNGICLVQIEWLVAAAWEDYRTETLPWRAP